MTRPDTLRVLARDDADAAELLIQLSADVAQERQEQKAAAERAREAARRVKAAHRVGNLLAMALTVAACACILAAELIR